MIRSIILTTAILALVASSPAILIAQESTHQSVREWKSKDGANSVNASLVSYDRQSRIVTLRDRSGDLIHVNIAQLSRKDRRFVSSTPKRSDASIKSDIFKPTIRREVPESDVESNQSDRASARTTQKQRLYGINWIPGVENALEVARTEKRKRPVMWFRVLGELDGLM